MYRAVKNTNKIIIAIGSDENQSGNYPDGATDSNKLGVWCEWAFSAIPSLSPIANASPHAMRFKENDAGDGIDLRSDADVLATPNG